ncbi:inositol 1,4,5-triphosphate receptor associated 1-like isoform X2 [Ascaphus truei]|uniref:inositol 1,4,5-triphosphate receptor associated 1-like isoform X2 n=1 Tax=Ascaphus truei TaxID=8439 RepID=UPI003F590E2D
MDKGAAELVPHTTSHTMQSDLQGGKASDGIGSEESNRCSTQDRACREGESSESDEGTPIAPPPDLSVLEMLRLHRLSLTEQDAEEAFAQLSLSLRCDTFTLCRRLQVEERARDLAESNIQREMQIIRDTLQSPQCSSPRCQSISHLTLSALPALSNSVRRLSKAAECLGAAHQEARTSRAVELMVQHVENLRGRQEPREKSEEEWEDEVEATPRQLGGWSAQAPPRHRVSVSVIPKLPAGMLGNISPGPEPSRGCDGERPQESVRERSRPHSLCDSLSGLGALEGQNETAIYPRGSLRRLTDEGETGRLCDTWSCNIVSMLHALPPHWLLSLTLLALSCLFLSRVLQLPKS